MTGLLSGREINEFNATLYIDLAEQDLFMIFDGVDAYIKPSRRFPV